MSKKENITLRVPQDTYEQFERYRKERGGISKADAGRRLLQDALDETPWVAETLTGTGSVLNAVALVGVVDVLLTSLVPSVLVLGVALLSVAVNAAAWRLEQ